MYVQNTHTHTGSHTHTNTYRGRHIHTTHTHTPTEAGTYTQHTHTHTHLQRQAHMHNAYTHVHTHTHILVFLNILHCPLPDANCSCCLVQTYLATNIFCIPATVVLPEDQVQVDSPVSQQDYDQVQQDIENMKRKILAVSVTV